MGCVDSWKDGFPKYAAVDGNKFPLRLWKVSPKFVATYWHYKEQIAVQAKWSFDGDKFDLLTEILTIGETTKKQLLFEIEYQTWKRLIGKVSLKKQGPPLDL